MADSMTEVGSRARRRGRRTHRESPSELSGVSMPFSSGCRASGPTTWPQSRVWPRDNPGWTRWWFDAWTRLQAPGLTCSSIRCLVAETLVALALIFGFARKLTCTSAAVISKASPSCSGQLTTDEWFRITAHWKTRWVLPYVVT
jgi:hypothetical protein